MARPAVQSQSLFGRGIGGGRGRGGGPPRVHAQYAMAAPAAPNPYTPSATLFGAPATGGFGGMGMGMGASSSGSAPAANPFGSSSSFGFAAPQQQQGAVNSYSAAPPRWQSAATVDLLSFDATSHYAPSISAQPTGYSAFGSAAPGSAAPPSGLFGSAAPSVFGSAPPAPSKPQTAGLFGGGGGGPATGFGRAGSAAPRKMAAAPSSHSSSPSGLFGGAAPTLAASGSSPFGAGAAWGSTPAPASNTFGAAAAADPLEALARLQSFDGCFSLEVLNVIKLNTDIQSVRNVLPAGVPDNLIASLIAMAFLSTKLGAGVDRDSWEGIHDKAQQYVEAALQGVGVEEAVDVLEGKVARLLL
ncbi:hypothetical protein C8R43DRAFT_1050718 [Mycena crocata]|nr:hypothetical protein C8R43DRAFT_1050718 [Mycena crocata]